ncbi:MAG: hypothetical protein IJ367_00820, partial [Clostridia bacterium]|nr:hypothetical protein [Clostridia bacterium]
RLCFHFITPLIYFNTKRKSRHFFMSTFSLPYHRSYARKMHRSIVAKQNFTKKPLKGVAKQSVHFYQKDKKHLKSFLHSVLFGNFSIAFLDTFVKEKVIKQTKQKNFAIIFAMSIVGADANIRP